MEYPRRQLSHPVRRHDDSHVELEALLWLTRSCATRTLHVEVYLVGPEAGQSAFLHRLFA